MSERREIEEWRKRAVEEQIVFAKFNGKNEWDSSSRKELEIRLAFALYNCPKKVPEEKLKLRDYTNEQQEKVTSLTDVICRNQTDKILMSMILICGRLKTGQCFTEYVFRVPDDKFVDLIGRVYNGWKDFEKNNRIPEAIICYPVGGKYTFVETDKKDKNAEDIILKIATTLKIGNIILEACSTTTILSGGIMLSSLIFPVAAPVIMGACAANAVASAYFAGRSVEALVDRKQHEQSLDLTDPEARREWLGLASSVTGLIASGATAYAARMQQTKAAMSGKAKLTVHCANSAHCAMSGLQTVNDLVNAIRQGEKITTTHILQCIGSVLLLGNAIINAHQARIILESLSQNNDLTGLLNTISAAGENVGVRVMENLGAQTIPLPFLRHMSVQRNFTIDNVSAGIGLVISTIKYLIENSTRIVESFERFCKHIFASYKRFEHDCRDLFEFAQKLWNLIEKEFDISEFLKKLLQLSTCTYPLCDSDEGIKQLTLPERRAITEARGYISGKEDVFMKLVSKFSDIQKLTTFKDFAKCLCFVAKHFEEDTLKKEEDFKRKLENANGTITEAQLENIYGITGNRSEYFLNQAIGEYIDNSYNFEWIKLIKEYKTYNKTRHERGTLYTSEMLSLDHGKIHMINMEITENEISKDRLKQIIKSYIGDFEVNCDHMINNGKNKSTYFSLFKHHKEFKMALVLSSLEGSALFGAIVLLP